jgi:hypothetical protein
MIGLAFDKHCSQPIDSSVVVSEFTGFPRRRDFAMRHQRD